jgi:radical SAM superfamily enzyme YgiQ (UPF0313 family)
MEMEYDWPLFRPPSEAESLIIQASYGCSANTCKFCYMYKTKKFRVRPLDDVLKDLRWCAENVEPPRRIFIADGDALAIPAKPLLEIIKTCYRLFPGIERVSSYANPGNLLEKSGEELKAIREAGLTLIYYGVETGDDDLLVKIKKQADTREMIEGCAKAHKAGLEISVTVLLGLAGKKGSEKHAKDTAALLNNINPRYISALTLMLGPFEKVYQKAMGPDFEFLGKLDFLSELKWLVEGLNVKDCIFRSNHASNYLPLKGTLDKDKAKLLAVIDKGIAHPEILRPDEFRAL